MNTRRRTPKVEFIERQGLDHAWIKSISAEEKFYDTLQLLRAKKPQKSRGSQYREAIQLEIEFTFEPEEPAMEK